MDGRPAEVDWDTSRGGLLSQILEILFVGVLPRSISSGVALEEYRFELILFINIYITALKRISFISSDLNFKPPSLF